MAKQSAQNAQSAQSAQVSLELLLVLAALAALLLAFLPFANQARAAAQYAVALKQEQIILAQTAADCREASLLGPGTAFARRWFLPAETVFSFEGNALKLEFEAGGKRTAVVQPLGFSAALKAAALPRGSAGVRVENKAGAVVVSIQEEK